jgi:hypothetical protein
VGYTLIAVVSAICRLLVYMSAVTVLYTNIYIYIYMQKQGGSPVGSPPWLAPEATWASGTTRRTLKKLVQMHVVDGENRKHRHHP